MKLLAKYNRVNMLTTIVVMFITGIIYYQAISWILTNQRDKNLNIEEKEIFDYVDLNHRLPQTFPSDDQQISFSEAKPGSVQREYINTIYLKKRDKDDPPPKNANEQPASESGRGLISSVTVGNKYYKILIVESKVETEYLIRMIFFITIGVVLLLVLVLSLTNRLILSNLWRPFHNLMTELRFFNITDTRDISKLDTDIDEFKELNEVVSGMATKAKHDYKDLKTFTENASHELLTPIAVINSKLDTLIQTQNFNERQSKLLNDLYSAVSRLNRLNQSLLLLVKIENRLLHERQVINLRTVVDDLLIQFEEIFHDKKIMVSSNMVDKDIHASRYLVDILLSNLISNATRHNHLNGTISITLTDKSLFVKNTGEPIPLPEEKIFTRFHKSLTSEGSGLGLTISRQICENFGFSLNYSFESGYHLFIVDF